MLVLYEHPLSPYAQKVKISAREKNADLDLRTPDGIGAGTSQGEFVAANPRAEVPVLIDGGTRIFDSTIILEYLEDKFPSPAMLPATPEATGKRRLVQRPGLWLGRSVGRALRERLGGLRHCAG